MAEAEALPFDYQQKLADVAAYRLGTAPSLPTHGERALEQALKVLSAELDMTSAAFNTSRTLEPGRRFRDAKQDAKSRAKAVAAGLDPEVAVPPRKPSKIDNLAPDLTTAAKTPVFSGPQRVIRKILLRASGLTGLGSIAGLIGSHGLSNGLRLQALGLGALPGSDAEAFAAPMIQGTRDLETAFGDLIHYPNDATSLPAEAIAGVEFLGAAAISAFAAQRFMKQLVINETNEEVKFYGTKMLAEFEILKTMLSGHDALPDANTLVDLVKIDDLGSKLHGRAFFTQHLLDEGAARQSVPVDHNDMYDGHLGAGQSVARDNAGPVL